MLVSQVDRSEKVSSTKDDDWMTMAHHIVHAESGEYGAGPFDNDCAGLTVVQVTRDPR